MPYIPPVHTQRLLFQPCVAPPESSAKPGFREKSGEGDLAQYEKAVAEIQEALRIHPDSAALIQT